MATAAEIAAMSTADKIGNAMRRSIPHLPDSAKAVVESMVSPGSLTLIAATMQSGPAHTSLASARSSISFSSAWARSR